MKKELKRRLALYENPNVLSSQRRYPSQKHGSAGGKRSPGSPRGHPGRTRQTPKPDVVKEPEWNKCLNCGGQLGQPSFVGHKTVEEISNPSPKLVIDLNSKANVASVARITSRGIRIALPTGGSGRMRSSRRR